MMETTEPRCKFNDRTGRTGVFKLRDAEMEKLIDHHSGLVKDELVEERMCPLCEDHPKNAEQIWIKEGLKYNKCKCGMVYIAPILKQKVVDEYYATAESAKQWLEVLQAQENLDETKFDHLLDRVSRHIFAPGPPAKPSLLDVGASYGFFLNLATSYRWNFDGVGLELSGAAFDLYIKKEYHNNFPIYTMKLEDYLKSPTFEKADLVTMWEVLEHVPDPKALLEQAKKVLKRDGLLAVLVPNLWARTNRYLHEKSRAFGANHLNYWNVNTLRRQLSEAGFGTCYEETIIGDVNTWWNHLNYEDPYTGSLVHPDHKRATEQTLQEGAGYKFFTLARARG